MDSYIYICVLNFLADAYVSAFFMPKRKIINLHLRKFMILII